MNLSTPFAIAVLLNRTSPGLACWNEALAFLHAANTSVNTAISGVFITGHCIDDVISHKLSAYILQEIKSLSESGLCFLVCSSRLPDDREPSLPPGLKAGSLGQWMEWVEASQQVVEWA